MPSFKIKPLIIFASKLFSARYIVIHVKGSAVKLSLISILQFSPHLFVFTMPFINVLIHKLASLQE